MTKWDRDIPPLKINIFQINSQQNKNMLTSFIIVDYCCMWVAVQVVGEWVVISISQEIKMDRNERGW